MYILGLLFIGLSTISVSECRASKNKTPFPYILEEEHHAVAGRVNYDAHRGSRVKAIPEKHHSESQHESHSTEGEGQFLRVIKKLAESGKKPKTPVRFDVTGMTRKPTHSRLTSQNVNPSESSNVEVLQTGSPSSLIHTLHKRSTGSDVTSDHMTSNHWHKVEGIVPHRTRPISNSILPLPSVETTAEDLTSNMAEDETLFREVEDEADILLYTIMETDLFYIDSEDYVAVANSTTFRDYEAIEFYVYLSNEKGDVLSTPYAFIIYIDQPGEASDEYPAAPAIFAGVLVLVIVFLALFIPFVTRAKRRYRQGKPVFKYTNTCTGPIKMGSHPSISDLDTSAVIQRVETREPNWYGNNTLFSYEEEVERERDEFTTGIKRLSKKGAEPPTLQLHKKVKAPSSSSSSASEATASTQDDTKYTQRL